MTYTVKFYLLITACCFAFYLGTKLDVKKSARNLPTRLTRTFANSNVVPEINGYKENK